MKKSERFGCEKCPEYLPSHGKVINGVAIYPGIGNVPTAPGNGRCELVKRMVRRMKKCPRVRLTTSAQTAGCTSE